MEEMVIAIDGSYVLLVHPVLLVHLLTVTLGAARRSPPAKESAHDSISQARRRHVDRALPGARHGPGVVRGLDVAGVLRARTRGDLPAGVAQRRARRASCRDHGSWFTKDLVAARTSLARRARHGRRGPRVPQRLPPPRQQAASGIGSPREETCGVGRQFVCKYHGWRYGLDGGCTYVHQEDEFFDSTRPTSALVPVHCEVWAGFIFVNLAATPRQIADASTSGRWSARSRATRST